MNSGTSSRLRKRGSASASATTTTTTTTVPAAAAAEASSAPAAKTASSPRSASAFITTSEIKNSDIILPVTDANYTNRPANKEYVEFIQVNCDLFQSLPNTPYRTTKNYTDDQMDFVRNIRHFFNTVRGRRLIGCGGGKPVILYEPTVLLINELQKDGGNNKAATAFNYFQQPLDPDPQQQQNVYIYRDGSKKGTHDNDDDSNCGWKIVENNEQVQKILKFEGGPKNLLVLPPSMNKKLVKCDEAIKEEQEEQAVAEEKEEAAKKNAAATAASSSSAPAAATAGNDDKNGQQKKKRQMMEDDDEEEEASTKPPAAKKIARWFGFGNNNDNDKQQQQEPPVVVDPPTTTTTNGELFLEDRLGHLLRCTSAEGIRETSVFRNKPYNSSSRSGGGNHYYNSASASAAGSSCSTFCLRKILSELTNLEDHLPKQPAIFVKFDEEMPQYLRAIITAPNGTPYSYGLFCFDIFLPDNYPQSPPAMQLLTTGNGSVRFSPNLYADGKVCLSLLNTWQGPKWNPHQSSLLQVLVSIQALILGVKHPYYLEPGHGGWEGHVNMNNLQTSTNGSSGGGGVNTVPTHVQRHQERLMEGTVKFALLETLRATRPRYLQPFAHIIESHFYEYKDEICREVQGWVVNGDGGRKKVHPTRSTAAMSVARKQLQQHVKQLQDELSKLPKPAKIEEEEDPLNSKLPVVQAATATASLKTSDEGDQPAVAAAAGAAAKGGVMTVATANGVGGESTDVVERVAAVKQLGIEQAVAHGDYITAGRLQSELFHLKENGNVETKIALTTHAMDHAASQKDYVLAGQLQVTVRHLEKNQKLLQDLEKRMFDAATKLDFVKAGRFQEQYKILLHPEDDGNNQLASAAPARQTMATTATTSPFSSFAVKLEKLGAAVGAANLKGPPPPPAPSVIHPPVYFSYEEDDGGFVDDVEAAEGAPWFGSAFNES